MHPRSSQPTRHDACFPLAGASSRASHGAPSSRVPRIHPLHGRDIGLPSDVTSPPTPTVLCSSPPAAHAPPAPQRARAPTPNKASATTGRGADTTSRRCAAAQRTGDVNGASGLRFSSRPKPPFPPSLQSLAARLPSAHQTAAAPSRATRLCCRRRRGRERGTQQDESAGQAARRRPSRAPYPPGQIKRNPQKNAPPLTARGGHPRTVWGARRRSEGKKADGGSAKSARPFRGASRKGKATECYGTTVPAIASQAREKCGGGGVCRADAGRQVVTRSST
eukprot:354070-Chlamydomonas_euryale.AAC.4